MKAILEIETAKRGQVTVLKNSYVTPPFKVANITEDKKSAVLHLMLMSSSPGILDGDVYSMRIVLEENCLLQLHTQSYQRLFNMKTGASQNLEVHLAKNSTFIYLLHPVVPHEGASFVSKNQLYLSDECTLIFGEILTCGRQLNKEVFQFTKIHNLTEVYLQNKLVVKENLLIHPSVIDPNSMGQLEGFTHQASFLFIKENLPIIAVINHIYAELIDLKNIEFGISELPVGGFILRILGYKAEQLYTILQDTAAKLIQLLDNFKANNTA